MIKDLACLLIMPSSRSPRALPWLMLGARLLFAFSRHLTNRISAGISHESSDVAVVGASIFELAVAIYGGYFGGGIGIFFSSRRRHTRLQGDWSSDVCSSD